MIHVKNIHVHTVIATEVFIMFLNFRPNHSTTSAALTYFKDNLQCLNPSLLLYDIQMRVMLIQVIFLRHFKSD